MYSFENKYLFVLYLVPSWLPFVLQGWGLNNKGLVLFDIVLSFFLFIGYFEAEADCVALAGQELSL